ncbi:hypothetical protein ACNFU2_01155 [Chryseobacterium sp. PTM-20240506]|uniref:hypothetical protein n=1 Tax=Chryseobacterium sp. PTM-20240506 TaxID=3400631 RepID=UPI003AABADEE|nr:hypothetical protein [Elizabethkingia anophelis]
MNYCKICNSIADKTGSHIIPHFLLKRIDSEHKGRDKEMGFVISERNPSSYFGRSTNVETLKKIYGEISDERISDNSIPLVEDYIFCSRCEAELATLENNYSVSISKNGHPIGINYSSGINSEQALLFWISIFFRLSISKNSGVKLLSEDEDTLRNILNEYFSKKQISSEIDKVKYKILRAQNVPEKASTLLHINPESQNPYLLVVDEFIVYLSLNTDVENNDFYGFRLPVEEAEQNSNAETDEKILAITTDTLLNLNGRFHAKAAEFYRINLFFECDQIFQKMNFGGKMPDSMKEEIFKALANDEKVSFGDKFSTKHRAENIVKVLQQYLKK